MGRMRNSCKMLVVKCKGKRPLERSRRKWKDNIEMDIKEIEYYSVDWIYLVQVRDQWLVLMNILIHLRFYKRQGISSLAEQLLASQEKIITFIDLGESCSEPGDIDYIDEAECRGKILRCKAPYVITENNRMCRIGESENCVTRRKCIIAWGMRK
jgi:hypothetical protein